MWPFHKKEIVKTEKRYIDYLPIGTIIKLYNNDEFIDVESDYKIIHEGYKNNKFEELNARLTEVFNLFK